MTEQINTFELSKEWHEYMAENINVKPIHSCLYFAIVNKWNVLFWKKQFGLPTENMMQTINILSYKTYIKTLNELEEFGFIKIVSRSKNQNTSNIVEVVNNTKATTKANTKAMLKATTQSDDQSEHQSDDQSVASIIKQLTNNKELLTKNNKDELKKLVLSFETTNKLKTLEERKNTFYSSLNPFLEKYNKELLREFYDYWIELNKNKTKMRFESEKFFDVSRRLATWNKNNKDKIYTQTNGTSKVFNF